MYLFSLQHIRRSVYEEQNKWQRTVQPNTWISQQVCSGCHRDVLCASLDLCHVAHPHWFQYSGRTPHIICSCPKDDDLVEYTQINLPTYYEMVQPVSFRDLQFQTVNMTFEWNISSDTPLISLKISYLYEIIQEQRRIRCDVKPRQVSKGRSCQRRFQAFREFQWNTDLFLNAGNM
jgi:hypothetical protein